MEIGAGLGALTVFLAQAARRVVALERDPALAQFLQEELFPETPAVEVRCQDVLRFDFLELSRESGRPLAVAGNLPYQITSPLLFKLMAERAALSRAVLMMQQEVGARLLAPPGHQGLRHPVGAAALSFLHPAPLFPGAGQFFPAAPGGFGGPEADARRHLAPGPGPGSAGPGGEGGLRPAPQDPEQHPDRPGPPDFGLSPEQMRAIFGDLGIDPGRRGETLSLAEFVALSNKMAEMRKNRGQGSGVRKDEEAFL